MIRIHISDEAALKSEYLGRMKPLIQERISFYRAFFGWRNGNLTFNQFIASQVHGRAKYALVNLLSKKFNFERQEDMHHSPLIGAHIRANAIAKGFDFLTKVEASLDSIIVGSLSELILLARNIDIAPSGAKKIIKNLIKGIFDYGAFSGAENLHWGYGAAFSASLNLNVCPYCNRNYITTVLKNGKEKVIGPSFDHFLPKHAYPLFLVSLFNLIPSCTVCNSNLKGKIPFDDVWYLYPYQDEVGDDVRFDFFLSGSDANISAASNYQIRLAPADVISEPKRKKLYGPQNDSKKGSLKVFKTEEIYRKAHSDVVAELITKCNRESVFYARSVRSLLGQKITLHEFYRFYFGNYINKRDWNKRPLAKLTYDIVSRQLNEFVHSPLDI